MDPELEPEADTDPGRSNVRAGQVAHSARKGCSVPTLLKLDQG
jgi:hypothetical protein